MSISKSKTFSPVSSDRDHVYARLVRNLESAFIKLRRHKMRTRHILVSLRRKDYSSNGAEARLNRSTSATNEVLPILSALFDHIFDPAYEYRATTVVLAKLESDNQRQYDLFEDNLRIEKLARMADAIDKVNGHFGKHKLNTGTALYLNKAAEGERNSLPWRKNALLDGETARKRINIPRLDMDV